MASVSSEPEVTVINSTVDMFVSESNLHSDPFEDDAPLVCGVENPETCESCQ